MGESQAEAKRDFREDTASSGPSGLLPESGDPSPRQKTTAHARKKAPRVRSSRRTGRRLPGGPKRRHPWNISRTGALPAGLPAREGAALPSLRVSGKLGNTTASLPTRTFNG